MRILRFLTFLNTNFNMPAWHAGRWTKEDNKAINNPPAVDRRKLGCWRCGLFNLLALESVHLLPAEDEDVV